MQSQGLPEILKGVEESSFNPKHALTWLESQPEAEQPSRVGDLFQALLQSAAKPKQSSGNACVKLCGLVELCARSASPCLKEFAFAEDTATTLFNFFIEWNEQDAHRSMRLVLDFLVHSATQNPSPQTGSSIKSRMLMETISMVTEKSSRPSIKSALTALDHMLQKKLIYLGDILSTYQENHKSSTGEETTWEALISQIFDWMVLHYVCPAAGKLIVTMLTSPWYRDKDERHSPKTWHKFIYPALESNSELLEPIRLYILIPLFKTDRAGALEYLQQLTSLQGLTGDRGEGWNLNAMLWLSMLEAGKKVGVVDEPGQGLKQKPGAVTQLDAHILQEVLCHESHDARSSAVAILIASPSTTRPYTPEVLDLLKRHLPSFHSDSNSKFRYEVLGHSRNMIKRIHGALESVRRDYEKAVKKATANTSSTQQAMLDSGVRHLEDTLRKHRAFVFWYLNFLRNEMSPTASYQRHITSLKAMNFVLGSPLIQESEISMFGETSKRVVDKDWLRCVLDLVMDPFDDVRDAAAGIIMSLATTNPKQSSSEVPVDDIDMAAELTEFCKRADTLASKTARADHSDGVARSYQLLHLWKSKSNEHLFVPNLILDDLEKKIISAEKDLAAAVLETPVHGNFAALRYLWNSLTSSTAAGQDSQHLNDIQSRAITCCQRIWEIVQHILCDDSPEGHLPEELEEVDGLDTKDLLSYSFRAIHESSNLVRVIAMRLASESKTTSNAQSLASFEVIGRLTFQELSNLRHRGAFTTVSQTFATCCQLVKYFPARPGSPDLLAEWYQGALDCIHTQASTTRRSAGIPALIVGILSSNAEEPSFQSVIQQLQRISRRPARVAETDGSNLSQVHALNSLKDIFKSSYLSKRAEPYLTECLQLAAECLKSEVWAIRNCGLLLLRSLIDCLLGTNESKTSMEAGWDGKTTRISYHKFPELPAVLFNLLEMGKLSEGVLIGSQSAESVFPALDIIRRAGPPEAFRDELYGLISWYLGSRIWHVREIAARTLCSFLLRSGWIEDIRELIRSSQLSANQLHGALITLKFLLERLSAVMPEQLSVQSWHNLSETLASVNVGMTTCTEVQAAYLEVLYVMDSLRSLQPTSESSGQTSANANIEIPKAIADGDMTDPTSALLNIRKGLGQVQRTILSSSSSEGKVTGNETLKQSLKNALATDINVSCAMLESLSVLPTPLTNEVMSLLVDANLAVCFETEASEPTALALVNLGALFDRVLSDDLSNPAQTTTTQLDILPSTDSLIRLWGRIATRPAITPSLSEAIMTIGGSMLAVVITRGDDDNDKGVPREQIPSWLRSWGFMMATAGLADQTFDTRMAAATAMVSMATTVMLTMNKKKKKESSSTRLDQAHLPWLIALYDALNDDDDEIREVAATAAGHLLGQSLAPIEAGARLLDWLCGQYAGTNEFRGLVAYRMVVGHESSSTTGTTENSAADGVVSSSISSSSWVPAAHKLREAMHFDDALFVVEEQNLYIDEVRESQRWQGAFAKCFPQQPITGDAGGDVDDILQDSLSSWTLSSLQTLNAIVEEQGRDGALGWTSKPAAYAICCRIIVCGVSIIGISAASRHAGAGDGGDGKERRTKKQQDMIRDELARLGENGRKNEVHGLLLGLL